MPAFQRPADSFLFQSDRELLRLELFLVERINEERVALGLSRLAGHALLAAIARAHSAEMRDKNYFAHESPTPHLRSPSDRYFYAWGEEPTFLAENIAYQRAASFAGIEGVVESWVRQKLNAPFRFANEDVERSHQGLMNSPGHRANILHPGAEIVGAGLVSRGYELWLTQLFSRR